MLKFSCLNARQLLQPFPLVNPLLSAYLGHEALLMTQRAHGLLHELPQNVSIWQPFPQRLLKHPPPIHSTPERLLPNTVFYYHSSQKNGQEPV